VELSIQSYDVFMLAVLALATLFGVWKGMAWQVASVSSFVLSFIVASRCSNLLAPRLGSSQPWNQICAMLILFIATSAAVWIVFRLVSGAIDSVRLKSFDRQIGALFGLVKGVLLCLVITFFAVTLSEAARQKVLKSRSGYYIAVLIDRANPVLPQEVRGVLGQYIDELDRKLDPNTPLQKPLSVQTEIDQGLGWIGSPSSNENRLATPADQPLPARLGIDQLGQRIEGVQQGIQGVGRTIEDAQREYNNTRDSLEATGQEIGRGLGEVQQRMGDLRLGLERPKEHRE
jgi:membrane protein required for colicin V production